MQLREVVEELVKKLVTQSEEVEVSESESDRGENVIVFSVRVAKQDMGRVIGKKGVTITALRTIVGAFGVKQNQRYVFELVEED